MKDAFQTCRSLRSTKGMSFRELLELRRGVRYRFALQLNMFEDDPAAENGFLQGTDEEQVQMLLPALREYNGELTEREKLQRRLTRFEKDKKKLIRDIGNNNPEALLVLYHSWVAHDMRAIVRLEDARKALGRDNEK